MNELEQIRVFVCLVECQSASKAAEKLGLANSAVSRRMKELETRLGVQLIQRTTRRMKVTDDGDVFYQRCKHILEDLEEAENWVGQSSKSIKGTIRISAPLSFGVTHLSSALSAFMFKYPDINIDADLSDSRVDLIEHDFDLAIRIGRLEDSSLQARKLARITHVVCCAPSLINKLGKPDKPEDLADFPALCYSYHKNPNRWQYRDNQGTQKSARVRERMRSNNGDMLAEAAIAGLGIICSPTFIVHKAIERGLLKPILTDYDWFEMDMFAVYPQTRYVSNRVRCFIDFLIARFGEHPYWDGCMGKLK